MQRALLDTDILSEVLKGKDPTVREHAAAYLQHFGRLTTSAITVTEISKGLHQASLHAGLAAFVRALENIEVLPLQQPDALLAGQIYGELSRTGQPIGLADPMIASVALAHDCVLATGNTGHFQRVADLGHNLKLSNWRVTTH